MPTRLFAAANVDDSGKSLRETIESNYFQHTLKELRSVESTKKATPSGVKRTSGTEKTRVDYYLNKPISEVPADMKHEVVRTRMAREKNTNQFTDAPFAGDKM